MLATLAPLIGVSRAAEPASDRSQDDWFVIEMQGDRVGWMRTSESQTGAGVIRSDTEMELHIARGGAGVTIAMKSSFEETREGAPISMSSTTQFGAFPIVATYLFKIDHVIKRSTQAGRTTTKTVKAPTGDWLTPAAAQRAIRSYLEQGVDTFTITAMDPGVGLTPVEATYTVLARDEPAEALGKVVPAIKWTVTQSYMPGVESVEYVNHAGEPIRSEINIGGISMTILASDKQTALSKIKPAEMVASTLVSPTGDIPFPRRTQRATFLLSIPDGDLPTLPTQGPQRVERVDASSERVTIDMRNIAAASESEAGDSAYLASTAALDASDPLVIELARRATRRAGDNPAERAESMRRFVHDYIDAKSLDVGFATASEVCQTRAGDCSEHGVLLAAMLRADGVPSRVVSGLLYVNRFVGKDNVFGYHMWTQALLDVDGARRWVDLDATLGDASPADATHIAIAVSSLADGEMINTMASLAPMLGKLRIDVESVESGD